MQEEKFIEFLKAQKKQKNTIEIYVDFVKKIDSYLKNEKKSLGIDKSYLKDLQVFLKQWKVDKKKKQRFLLAMKIYGKATGNTNLIANANRLLGRGTWLSRLEETLNEHVGEELQQKIMEAGGPIKQTSTTARKAVWAKCMMDCLEANVDEKTCKKILTNNLHFKSPKSPSFKKLKRMYEKSGSIDVVLQYLHDKWKKTIGDRYGYDSQEYKYVEADPTIEAGVRKGNIVYVSKIPFQIKQFIETDDEQMKRYHYCHCAWVRDSIKKPKEEQVSVTFFNC
ncbi:MAG: hypothetical protein FK732_01700 [Asgard group archaeon]|nr:hypothetical protein [Asgard group archaeon]